MIPRWAGVLAAALSLSLAAPAQGEFEPLELRVDGGEESWHPGQAFSLHWSNPPGVVAVHYRLLGPSGQVLIADTRMPWAATTIYPLRVLPDPGVYTAEVWLEDSGGTGGPAESAKLQFDDSPPGAAEPLPATGWIGRTAFPYSIRLTRPDGPQPLAGIRGYAVSVDSSTVGRPCAEAVCTDAETNLEGGIDDDALTIGELPEGTHYVHAVAVSGSGVASRRVGTTALRVDKTDPRTILAGVPAGWSKGPVALRADAEDAASGMAAAGPTGPFTAIRIDDGVPIVAAGDTVETTAIASGIHTVAYYARDAAGNVNDGAVFNGLANRSPQTAVIKIDREPPTLAFAAAQSATDPELILARASDAASGLDPSRGAIAVRRADSGEPFRELATGIENGVLRARWHSESISPGEYELRAEAFDRAGNAATSASRADGSPMRLHAPLKLPVRLEARPRTKLTRYGRRIWFGGSLHVGRRTPLQGTPVRVVERLVGGATPSERVTMVRTAAGGRFGLTLPAGPSREVIAEVSPTATTQGAAGAPSELAVKGRVSLRASSRVARVGGPPIVLRGRVGTAGARLPAEGKAIELQFRLPGLPWREFRTVRSNRRGYFRLAYRFSDDDSRGARFQFRAYAPAQSGWPYEPAGSPPVAVLGT